MCELAVASLSDTTARTHAMAPDEEPSALTLLVQALRRRWLLPATLLVLGTGFALGIALRQKKIYRSTATLEIDPNPPRPLGSDSKTVVDMGASSYFGNKEYYQTQVFILGSREVAEETVRRLRLQDDPTFIANVPPNTPRQDGFRPEELGDVTRVAALLVERLSVQLLPGSQLLLVSYEDASPARASAVLGTLVDSYLERNIDKALASANSAADWLSGQLGTLKNDLEKNEIALHDYKRQNGILSVSLDEQSSMLRLEMGQLQERLTGVRTTIQGLAARQAELAGLSVDDPGSLPTSSVLASPALASLREQYLAASREREGLLALGKGAEHPKVMAAKATESALKAALLREVENIRDGAARDLAAAKREEAGLAALYAAAKNRALDLGLLEIEHRRLARSRDNTEKLYALVLERSKESDLTRLMRFNNLHVIERPLEPKDPVRPSLPKSAAVGALAGLLLGGVLALGRERLDRSIKRPEQLEALGLSLLGVLPKLDADPGNVQKHAKRRARAGERPVGAALAAHRNPRSAMAEAARTLRTNLRFMATDRPYRAIVVTSAVPAEGKTTVASSIAISMAQAGQRVLLLDADLRRPGLHTVFERTRAAGLTSCLVDPETLQSSIAETEVPGLRLLGAGPTAPNPAELLSGERFCEILAQLEAAFDCVIVDSPPLLAVTDAALLAARVDGTILVVRAHGTTEEQVKRARRTLADVGARVAGVVLNDLRLRAREAYYYYGGEIERSELREAGRDVPRRSA